MALVLEATGAHNENLSVERLASGTLLVTINPTQEEQDKGDVRIEQFFMDPVQAQRLATLLLITLDFIK